MSATGEIVGGLVALVVIDKLTGKKKKIYAKVVPKKKATRKRKPAKRKR